jgi:predicted metal-dependent HD superfamily phosphohydrolase
MSDDTLPEILRARLTAMYAQPHRRYHTLAHVHALQRCLAHWQTLAREPRLIDAAIWFHDAIYETLRRDNEACSAALARTELGALGWPQADVERVAALVLATQDHIAAADDADAWLFLDLDLSVLAQDTAVYDRYSADVRAEYAWVADARYRSGRAAVLRSFLDRPQVYRTPELHDAWEDAARANLARELSALA